MSEEEIAEMKQAYADSAEAAQRASADPELMADLWAQVASGV